MKNRAIALVVAWSAMPNSAWAADTLRYCMESPVGSISPALSNVLADKKTLMRNVYDQLIEIGQNGELLPGLAESWSLSRDRLTYTFKIRRGVRFHDSPNGFKPTRDLNANDVVYTFMRFHDPKHSFHSTPQTKGGYFAYWEGEKLNENVASMKAVEAYVFQVTLRKPQTEFLDVLSTAPFSILSEEYGQFILRKNEDYIASHPGVSATSVELPINWYDTQPIGTGPYRIARFENGGIELEAMPTHYLGAAKIQTIEIIPVINPVERSQKLLDGSCDIVSEPTASDFDRLRKLDAEKLTFQETSTRNINFLTIGPTVPKEVRASISLALDRDRYVRELLGGHGRTVNSLLDASYLDKSYVPPENYNYNPQKSRQLLQNSSAARKVFTLLYLPAARPYNTDPHRLAIEMQKDLQAVGFQIRLATVGFNSKYEPTLVYDDTPSSEVQPAHAAYIRYVMRGQHEIAQYGDNPMKAKSYGRYLNALTSGIPRGDADGTNYSHWSNARIDANYAMIIDPANASRLPSLFQENENIIARELPYVPLFSTDIFRISRKDVQGYQLHRLHIERFATVSLLK